MVVKKINSEIKTGGLSGPKYIDLCLRWSGLAMLLLSWGSLLFLAIVAPVIPSSINALLRSAVMNMNVHYRWIPPLFAVKGLGVCCLLAVSSSIFRYLFTFRVYRIVLGLWTIISTAGIEVAVNSQPSCSALAMLISMFDFKLLPIAAIEVPAGFFGLLLLIPRRS